MKKIALLLLILTAIPAFASSPARYDLPIVTTTAAQIPPGSLPNLLAVVNATVAVCGYPAVLSNGMCTNTITTYTDSTLTTACPASSQLTAPGSNACIPTTGLQGAFGFWYNAATQTHMTYTLQTSWGTFGPYDILQGGTGGGGSGTVTNLSVGNLSPLFTASVANSTTTPAVTFTAPNFAAHSFYGNNTGSSAAPAASLIGISDWSTNAFVAGSGSAQAQTATLTPAPTALLAGLEVRWLPIAANTGVAPSLNVNGLGARTITKLGTTALAIADLTATAVADAIYDGAEWQLQNPQTVTGGGSGSPGGNNTDVQYNNDGAFGGYPLANFVVTNPTAAQDVEFDNNGVNEIKLINSNTGISSEQGFVLNNGLNQFEFALAGQGAPIPNAAGFTETLPGAPMTFQTNNGQMVLNPGTGGINLPQLLSAPCLGTDGSGNVGNGTGCSGSSLPTAAAAGQGLASTAAGTTYAVQPANVYWNSGDTIASVNANTLCATACTYHLTGTVTVSATATLNAAVAVVASGTGQFSVSSAQTLTLAGKFSAPDLKQHFSGAGAVSLSAYNTLVPVEWFGAVGDWNGSTGTNNLTAIQKAINAISFGQILLQPLRYAIGGTLAFSASNVGIQGTQAGRGGYNPSTAVYYSSLVETTAGDDAIDVHGTSGTYVDFGMFQDFNVMSSVAQTGTAAGLSLSFTGGVTVRNMLVQDFFYPLYLHASPSYGNGGIFHTSASWTSLSSGMTSPVGFFLDSGDGNAEDSITLRDDAAGVLSGGPSTAIGTQIKGTAINDVDFFNFNTALVDQGVNITFSGSAANAASDIHFWGTTNDGFSGSAFYITGVTAASGGSIEINGGWADSANANGQNAIDIENSSGVTVSHVQIGMTTGANFAQGVYANGSSNIAINDNTFQYATANPIEFNSTTHSSIVGNVIQPPSGHAVTGNLILLAGTSTYDTVVGNTLGGYGTHYAIFTNTGTTSNNTIVGNAIDATNLTLGATGINGTANAVFNAGPNTFRSTQDTTGDSGTTLFAYRAIGTANFTGWNSATPGFAWSLGYAVPGGTAGNNVIFGYYNGTAWASGWSVNSSTGVLTDSNGMSTANLAATSINSVTLVANATTTVGTTAISANTCTSVTTVTMTGIATTSTFTFTPNADVSGVTGWGSSGGLTIDAWPTTNTLNYKVCNQTASSITPSASVTFNVSAR